MTLSELIEALEKATAEDERRLVLTAIGIGRRDGWLSGRPCLRAMRFWDVGAYTSAALTLVPVALEWEVMSDVGKGWANVFRYDIDIRSDESPRPRPSGEGSSAPTPALALTCMKARREMA